MAVHPRDRQTLHDDSRAVTTIASILARETEAAAKLLRSNYETLGDWPLAITAYNYGTAGTARAAEQCGSDYCKILKTYNGPHFGFAVKNYYCRVSRRAAGPQIRGPILPRHRERTGDRASASAGALRAADPRERALPGTTRVTARRRHHASASRYEPHPPFPRRRPPWSKD